MMNLIIGIAIGYAICHYGFWNLVDKIKQKIQNGTKDHKD